MIRITKNTLLNYAPANFEVENPVNPARIFETNNNPIKSGNIIYICEREIRVIDNFALQFALQKSKELNLPLKIIHPSVNYENKSKQKFIDNQIEQAQKTFRILDLDFEITNKTPSKIIKSTNPAI